MEDRLDTYLRSKYNDNTRRYAQSIVKYLNTRTPAGDLVSVKSKELQERLVPAEVPYVGVFFRILKELCDSGIVKKEIGEREPGKRGKSPVFYKLDTECTDKHLVDHDVLVKRYAELAIAKELLKEYGCKDPEAEIEKRFHEIYGSTVEEIKGDD